MIALMAGGGLAMLSLALGDPADEAAPAPEKTAEELDRDLDYYRVVRVKETIRQSLKDPDSVRWGRVFVSRKAGDPVVCGSVNAKNSFGGYTGEQHFIATDDAVTAPSARPTAVFVRRWNEICAGVPVE